MYKHIYIGQYLTTIYIFLIPINIYVYFMVYTDVSLRPMPAVVPLSAILKHSIVPTCSVHYK